MLVCRAGWTRREEEQLSLLDALHQIQKASVNGALHQAVSLADMHKAVPDLEGGRLFNTTVTFMPRLDDEAQEGLPLAYEQVLNQDPTEVRPMRILYPFPFCLIVPFSPFHALPFSSILVCLSRQAELLCRPLSSTSLGTCPAVTRSVLQKRYTTYLKPSCATRTNH